MQALVHESGISVAIPAEIDMMQSQKNESYQRENEALKVENAIIA